MAPSRKNNVKETKEAEGVAAAEEGLPAPQGIGMAVAVDWGLVVQLLLTPIVTLLSRQSSQMMMRSPAPSPLAGGPLSFIIPIAGACIFALLGEMVRSGRNWALWIQLVFSSLLSIGGIVSLVRLYQGIQAGNFWPIVTEIILIVVAPLTVWRLSRPATRRWFKAVSAAEARRRHGGKWVWFIILWAIIGGVLQTFAAMSR
jgi:hypothetical protein